eukprot:TRINITY_DN26518_c0_g1_i1.p1 TRINITY_DN26518_c0_g1~~TRINITY_DN26518_c0_g1_i1.p1  ORF type:complete len:131 (+),score=43.87 TRINITY_DN26518_c0_g1_i1:389-781(+)
MAYKSSYRSEAGFSQRSALFSSSGSNGSSQQQLLQVRVEPRGELDDEVAGLRSQVRKLKEIAGEIGNEARQQNDILNQLEQTMIAAQAAVKEGVRKLNRAIASGGSSFLIQVLLFAVFAFLLVYMVSKVF